jgi:hypothetical protein
LATIARSSVTLILEAALLVCVIDEAPGICRVELQNKAGAAILVRIYSDSDPSVVSVSQSISMFAQWRSGNFLALSEAGKGPG